MAEAQRRYGQLTLPAGFTSEEEYLRWLSSGEEPFTEDTGSSAWRMLKQVGMGIPKAIPQLAQLPEVALAAARTGRNYLAGEPTTIYEEQYGKENAQKAQALHDLRFNETMSRLPPELRDNEQVQKRISASINGSQEMAELATSQASSWTQYNRWLEEKMNEFAGLPQPYQETSYDEAAQAVGTALLPTGWIKGLKVGAGPVARTALGAAELVVPGTSGGVGNFLANVGVDIGLGQGIRYATDMPTLLSETPIVEATPTETEARYIDPTTPPVQAATVTAPSLASDEGWGFPSMLQIGTAAAGIWAAAALFGKHTRLRPQIVNNTPAQAPLTVPPPPSGTPTARTTASGATPDVQPSLTLGEKVFSDTINARQPVINKVREATAHLPPDQQAAEIKTMERNLHAGSMQEKSAGFRDAWEFGNLPGNTTPSHITGRQASELYASFTPAQRTLFNDTWNARRYSHEQRSELSNLDKKIARLQSQLNNRNLSPAARQSLLSDFTVTQDAANRRRTGQERFASGMTRAEYAQLEQQFAADPKLRTMDTAFKQVMQDIDQSGVSLGHYTNAELARHRSMFDYTMSLLHDKYANMPWWERAFERMKQLGTGRDQKLYYRNRSADAEIGASVTKAVKVDTPIDPMTMLEKRMREHINYTRDNIAIKEFVRQVSSGPAWGRNFATAHKPISLSDFNHKPPPIIDDASVVAYTDGGKVHFMRVGDPEVVRGLRNSPGSSLVALDLGRRAFQLGTTGPLAPAFALKSALNSLVGVYSRGRGTSFGYIHAGLNRAFPNSPAADWIVDHVPDPTAAAKMFMQASKDISLPVLNALGEAVAKDLANRAGLFYAMSKLPGGHAVLSAASRNAILAFRNSDHLMKLRYGILGMPPFDRVAEAHVRGYHNVARVIPSSKATRAVRNAVDLWVQAFERLGRAGESTFFSQNLAKLQRQHGNRIPQTALDELVYKTKTFAGDMTRAPGSEAVNQLMSIPPYGRTMLNSNVHWMSVMKANPLTVGARVMTGVAIPWMSMVAYISNPGLLASDDPEKQKARQELMRWYYNDLPEWQRMTTMPLPTPDFLMGKLMGDDRPMTPDDVYLFQPFPEVIPYMATVLSLGRGTGALGMYAQKTQDPMSEAGQIVSSFLIPPENPFMALLGGSIGEPSRPDTASLDYDPGMKDAAVEVLGAIFGTVTDMLSSSFDAAGSSYEDNPGVVNSMIDAFSAAGRGFKQAVYEVERRLPEVYGTGAGMLTEGKRRYYASTEQRSRVLDAFDTVAPLYKQIGREKRAGGQEFPVERIRDPLARNMMMMVRSYMYTGRMNTLRDRRSAINNDLKGLEEKKGKFRVKDYDNLIRRYQKEMQEVNDGQEQIVNELNARLYTTYNTDLAGAVEYSRQFVQ